MLAGVDIENYNAESDWKTEDPQGSGGSNPSSSDPIFIHFLIDKIIIF